MNTATFRLSFNRTIWLLLFSIFCGGTTAAQLCNGSLGDPIVNITFGAGANAGPEISAVGIGYKYKTADCPDDGQYSIRNSTTTCFGNTWHSLTQDHTGDPKGYFMLVNASFQPSDFYVDTVRNLCSNTSYEFAAWIMNVIRSTNSIMPNVTFSIEGPDGTVYKKVNTGNLPVTAAPQWKQYGFWFSTPPGVQKVVLRITNNAPGGIGNDLVLDDITFRPCGPEVNVAVAGSGDTINICEDDTRSFLIEPTQVSGYQLPVFQWQVSRDSGSTWKDITGASNLSLNVKPLALGNYQYRLTIAEEENAVIRACRVASNAIVFGVHPLPRVDAGPDRKLIKGNTSTLLGEAIGNGLTFTWTPSLYLSDPGKLIPTVAATEDILYTLTALSPFGCMDKDVAWVKVADALFIPNAFTPNSDGNNDTWRIPYLDPYLEATVSVFNRYGQQVYHKQGEIVNWDGTYQGKPLPTGSYVYLIRIKKEGKTVRGVVTIVK